MEFYTRELQFFANFGLWDGLCDLQICAMCVGFPDCSKGRKRADKNNFSSVYPCIVCLFSSFNR